MGYTHYWKNEKAFTAQQWKRLCQDAKQIFAASEKHGVRLQFECDIDQSPVIDNDGIRFNGNEEQGYETFLLNRRPTDFDCCKTSYRPYDAAVVAVLIAAENIHGLSGFSWSSDGQSDPTYTDGAYALLKGVL